MKHLSSPHSHCAIVVLACLAAAACADRAPTDPTSALAPSSLSADRLTPTFDIQTIDVPGALATSPQGINAGGDISGSYTDAGKHSHGFVLHDGVFTTIDFPGADNTATNGIGPSGDVVGDYWNDNEEAVARHGYHRTADGQLESVHFPGHLYEVLQRISGDGTIVGCRHDHDFMASMRGIRIDRDGATEVDAFASMSNGVTPSGHRVVGFFTNMMNNHGESYIIDDGEVTTFAKPGSVQTSAWDVNPRGDIVGVYRNATGPRHGFVLTGAGYTTIDVPGASETRAFGTNARGDVVGQYNAGGKTHGFLAVRR